MTAEILLTIVYALLFLLIIRRSNFFSLEEIPQSWMSGVFVLKIICGILLGIIYTYYYTARNEADIYKYFDDSAILYNAAFINPRHFLQMLLGINSSADYLQPYYEKMSWWHASYNELFYDESKTMIRINALMRFFSFGYYNVHSVFFNFLSFAGLTALFKVFVDSLKQKSKELFAGVFLIPSVLFWGSGVLKESLEFFVMGILLYIFMKIVHEKISAWRIFLLLVLILFHVLIKFYILVSLIPGLVSYYIAVKTNYKKTGLTFFLTHLVFFLLLLNFHFIFPAADPLQLISSQYNKYLRFALDLHSGSLIGVNEMHLTILNLFPNSFRAFFTVLLHPHLFESKGILTLIAAAENFLILLIMIAVAFSFNPKSSIRNPKFYLSLYFVVIVFILVGLTTPMLGSIVRYKIPALPFLMYLFISLYDREKLFRMFPFIKKIIY